MTRKPQMIFLLILTSLALGAAPAEPAKDASLPLEGVAIDAMKLDDGAFRQRLEDGRTVTFTVNAALQRFADRQFDKYQIPAGSAVILNSRTGRVHALTQHSTDEAMSDLAQVALDPSPPAASLFKIVSAAALLEQGDVTPSTKTCYHGGSGKLLQHHLTDSARDDTACASLTAALGRSINAIFAKLSDRRLSRKTLAQYAERFGFNRDLPFDVAVPRSTAEIPDDRLERARTAAGFWHTHLSPLHAAVIAQAVAQDGAMLRPYIVDNITNAEGAVIYESAPEFLGRAVTPETADQLLLAMRHTVTRGTARKAFHDSKGAPLLPGIAVAGKTGTLTGKKPYRAYSWFVAIAPADDPEVAMAVLVVNKPQWRIKSTGMAELLLGEFFRLKKQGKI
ncbi:MAG: penicillin-binding protein [Deltaproteobacteria bacterium]|nr:penicillin-binding protein [Deltaproteobacteria bacterium]